MRAAANPQDLTGDHEDASMQPAAAAAASGGVVHPKTEHGEGEAADGDDDGWDDGSLSALDDPDFHSAGWVGMMAELGVSMPSEEELASERAADYFQEGRPTVAKSVVQRAPWNFNAHFLASPHVRARDKIPALLCLFTSVSATALGQTRVRLKDPFGVLAACVSAEVLHKWPALLSSQSAICLQDVTLFHGGPEPEERVLIVTNRNVRGVWSVMEHEAAEAAAAAAEEAEEEKRQQADSPHSRMMAAAAAAAQQG